MTCVAPAETLARHVKLDTMMRRPTLGPAAQGSRPGKPGASAAPGGPPHGGGDAGRATSHGGGASSPSAMGAKRGADMSGTRRRDRDVPRTSRRRMARAVSGAAAGRRPRALEDRLCADASPSRRWSSSGWWSRLDCWMRTRRRATATAATEHVAPSATRAASTPPSTTPGPGSARSRLTAGAQAGMAAQGLVHSDPSAAAMRKRKGMEAGVAAPS